MNTYIYTYQYPLIWSYFYLLVQVLIYHDIKAFITKFDIHRLLKSLDAYTHDMIMQWLITTNIKFTIILMWVS